MTERVVILRVIYIGVVACIALSGCVSINEMPGPRAGTKLVTATCNGRVNSTGDCLKAIAEACPNGYEIVANNQHRGQGAYIDANTGYASSYGTIDREVMAICSLKPPLTLEQKQQHQKVGQVTAAVSECINDKKTPVFVSGVLDKSFNEFKSNSWFDENVWRQIHDDAVNQINVMREKEPSKYEDLCQKITALANKAANKET